MGSDPHVTLVVDKLALKLLMIRDVGEQRYVGFGLCQRIENSFATTSLTK